MRGAGRWEWEKVVRAAGLPMAPALVAFVLATYADADGSKVRPSQSTLAEGLALSRSTITRAMGRLREEGYLQQVREPGPGRTAEYRLTLPGDTQRESLVLPKGGAGATEDVALVLPKGGAGAAAPVQGPVQGPEQEPEHQNVWDEANALAAAAAQAPSFD